MIYIIVQEQLVETKINPTTKKYYENLGFTGKVGDIIFVNPNLLQDNSSAIETRICDCCGEPYSSTHQALRLSNNKFQKDYCPNCVKTNPEIRQIVINKRKASNNIKYGTDTPAQNEEIKQKIINTNNEKYGVNSTLQTKEVQEKIKTTLKDKYDCDNPMKNPEIKEKAKKTCILRYGSDNPMKNKDILEKAQSTNFKKYGFKTSALNEQVRSKMQATLKRNDNVATSSQQKEIFKMVSEIYPNYKCELNYILSSLFLDVYLDYEGTKIDIEYDGSYWHQNKKKDFARDCVVKSNGYKVLRIRSGKLIPSKEQLTESIEKLKNSDYTFTQIILSDWKN